MNFMTAMCEEMKVKGMTSVSLSKLISVAPNTISTWFNRKCIPDAMQGTITEAIGSPRLSEIRCSMCQGNAFPTRYLDCVDDHPMVAIDKCIEEIDELSPMAKQVRTILINRRKGFMFSPAEEAVIRQFEDETADIITAAKTVLIRLQECYDRPVHITMSRHVEKLEQSGYCTKKCSPMRAAK
jgi:hypothetical protein